MVPDRDDEVVRAAFAWLKAEEHEPPTFRRVLAHRPAVSRVASAEAVLLKLAVAVVVLFAVGLVSRGVIRSERLVVPRVVTVLATWRPSTDVFLETPGRDLLRSTPTLESSILSATSTFEARSTGDRR
jgi:hypothetical protein